MAFVLTYYRDQNITGRVCAEEENFISLRKKSKADLRLTRGGLGGSSLLSPALDIRVRPEQRGFPLLSRALVNFIGALTAVCSRGYRYRETWRHARPARYRYQQIGHARPVIRLHFSDYLIT